MHDSTRRFLLLSLFVLIGPILSLSVLTVIVVRRLPGEAKRHEILLRGHSGHKISINSVEYKRPNQIRYNGVRLLDTFSEKTLIETPCVDLKIIDAFQWHKIVSQENVDKNGVYWHCKIERLNLDLSGNCERLMSMFFETLQKRNIERPKGIVFEIRSIGLSQQENPVLQDVFGYVSLPSEKNTECRIAFQLRDCPNPDPVQLLGERIENENGATIKWTLTSAGKESTGHPIPVAFLQSFYPTLAAFGNECRVSGTVFAEKHSSKKNWTLRFQNVCFRNGDLWTLTDGRTPYKIAGKIEGLNIDSASIIDGVLQNAQGFIEVQKGSIERGLLLAFIERFSLDVSPSSAVANVTKSAIERSGGSADDWETVDIPFDRCWGFFTVSEKGLFFRPHPDSDGLVLEYDVEKLRLYIKDSKRPVPLVRLLAAFQPSDAAVAPLNEATKNVLPFLPDLTGSKPYQRKMPIPTVPK